MDKKDVTVKKGMNKLQARRFWGILFGVSISVTTLILLFWPENDSLHAMGPMNIGHANLTCLECHKNSNGSLRQQLQSKVRFMLGLRSSAITIGHKQVSNESCLECHSRPNEQHPIYRFNEPRFADVRKELKPQNCTSCHNEHTGKRVTLQNVSFCISCHKETKLKKDTLDVPHSKLIAQNQWNTCLGCHDFHGNHKRKLPEVMNQVIPEESLQTYFEGKIDSPYSKEKIYAAKPHLTDDKKGDKK